ncbi:efflux RND transporter periplasmic adaptor subunit [Inhella gelatinilytica]|uniref:Efflux RND transporter periplasmic adaptor subunit n=1 Tax=Inhella gelatinilytica TaxID=2795030 RepID=A0A931NDY2_9BURK|nr:efflux RND transporter periplasmic adaptor subunit [Inhella gelatinilytica]MBH9553114.1 efflux RND transporter periplasmic adaptor subunit [Inhella gelatinilytica]
MNFRFPASHLVRSVRLAGAALLMLAACKGPAPEAAPERAVRTLVVQATEAGRALEFAAEVRARTESRLAFRVPGKVAERTVSLGDRVKAGQVLARLDPQDLALAAEAAQAGWRAAQAQREQSAADLKRYRSLKEQGFISGAELERREVAFQAAQSQFDQAVAQTTAQRNQADYAALKADAPGVITSVDVEPGMVVSAGLPVLRLAHLGPRDAVFSIPEHQVGAFREWAAAPGALSVRLWGQPEPLKARLRELAESADPVTRTFVAKVDLGDDASLKLGQTATVTLQLPKRSGVMLVPMTAVLEVQGKPQVWVLDPTSLKVQLQPVVVGDAAGNELVITAGLKSGQEVVTAGVHALTPGQKVRRYAASGAASAAQ